MNKIILLSFLLLSFTSCKRVCEDSKALNNNYDLFTREDNSLCIYSKAIFYVSGPSNYPPLSVYVDNQFVGNITTFYPYGPGNCSAMGCATYQFKTGNKVDWEVRDAAGNVVNGTSEPNSYSECIKIRVY